MHRAFPPALNLLKLQLLVALSLVFLAIHTSVARSEVSTGPAIWKVDGGKADLFLFGTFHLLPPDLDWINTTISTAMRTSGTLIVEADTSDDAELAAIVQKYAYNPDGKTLRSYFTPEEAERIDNAIKPYGLSIDSAARFRPWFVALQVGLAAMLDLGFDPDSGVEDVLMRDARERSISLGYLETGEAGIKALADHPDHLQAKMLLATLDDMEHIEELISRMIEAWAKGDITTVAQLLNASMARTPELIDAVLYQRNRTWIAPLKQMLESEGSYFVAVGAAHLAGPNSVVEMLEQEGYKVVRQ